MSDTIKDVLQFVKENDIKFIRLAFCDPLGIQKNVSILPNTLQSAFESGICIDASAVMGFSDCTHSDLLLFPELSTLTVLPLCPRQRRVARFSCHVNNPDGTAFTGDSRKILQRVIERLTNIGYQCKIGAECEFYLFKTDENGEPTETAVDNGGYLDFAPLDKGEDIRRDICLNLEEMGIYSEASYHQQGPGQNAIELQMTDALHCADNIQTVKSVIKSIAAKNDLFASFMPKPILGKSGSGLHLKISLSRSGEYVSETDLAHSDETHCFIAGILAKIREMTLFLNPLSNSYERFGTPEASEYVSWTHLNRSRLIRIPAADGGIAKFELRSPDPALNPYLALALIISAGLYGIEQKLPLPPSADENLGKSDDGVTASPERLPYDISEAVSLAEQSEFVRSTIGEKAFNRFIAIKKDEAFAFLKSQNKREFYREKYFKVV
ncbi:MAG: glutamine synthetase [Clostridiales bacterium]|nr:glutamine synthetase [Clostridiales bacterium]